MDPQTLQRALDHARLVLGEAEEKRLRADRAVAYAKAHVNDLEALERQSRPTFDAADFASFKKAHGA